MNRTRIISPVLTTSTPARSWSRSATWVASSISSRTSMAPRRPASIASRASQTHPGSPWLPTTDVGNQRSVMPLLSARLAATAQVRLDHARIAQHRVRRSRGDPLAEVEHRHGVGQVADQLHVVLDPQHRHAELVLDPQAESGRGSPSPRGSSRSTARRAGAAAAPWRAPGRSPPASGRRTAGPRSAPCGSARAPGTRRLLDAASMGRLLAARGHRRRRRLARRGRAGVRRPGHPRRLQPLCPPRQVTGDGGRAPGGRGDSSP